MKRPIWSKVLTWALVLSMCLVLFGGCKSSGSGQGSSTVSGSKLSGELVYDCMFNKGEPNATWIQGVATEFQKETGVKVKLTLMGRDVLTKVKSSIIMKNPPDIIDQDASELGAALWDTSVLAMPLDDVLNGPGPDGQSKMTDIFPSNVLSLYTKNDVNYVVPFDFVTSGFMYNKKYFTDNNLSVPTTWDQLISLCATLKSKGMSPIALDGNINFYNAYYYYWALERVMGSGNLMKGALDKTGAVWDDPGYLQAAQMVSQLSSAGLNEFEKGYAGSNYPAAQADWAQGKSGLCLCGTWLPNETQTQASAGFDYGFFPFPTVTGGKGAVSDVEGYLISAAIPVGAKNVANAKAFLKFMLTQKNAQDFATITGNISARKDVDYPKILTTVKPYVDQAQTWHLSYDGVMSACPDWFANVFYPLDNKLIYGQITPQAFISQMKQQTVAFYNK